MNNGKKQLEWLGGVSLVPDGEWVATKTYPKLYMVTHSNALYISKQQSVGIEPNVSTNWQQYWLFIPTETTIEIDDALSETSENPVQNKVITQALNGKQDNLTETQLAAVNSGIDSAKVSKIGTNETAIANINGKIPATASSENKLVDTAAMETFAMPITTKYGANLSLAFNSVNGVLTAQLKDQDGNNLGNAQEVTIDLTSIETAINNILALIPPQATSENQLADKNFVNSSISTNTAHFIGTFNSLAELEAYSGTVTNNDYANVIRTVDGQTYYDRYTYNGNTQEWEFNFTVNTTTFTAAQWAALNSGITASLVSAYNAHIADKNNPHEVTKAQVGLGNVDNTSDLNKPISTATQTAIATIETAYGATLEFTVNSSTYVLTAVLKNKDGTALSTQTVDLPLESVVVSGEYDDTTKSLILTLQNGNTITIPVGDLVSGLVPESRTVNGHALSSDITITKGDVGLGNVDNTSDLNKPVSTAQQAALNALKQDIEDVQVNKQDKLTQSTDLTPTTQTLNLVANTRYALGTLTALDLTFPAGGNDGDEIIIEFVGGSTATVLTLDNVNAIYNFNSISSVAIITLMATYKVNINKWVVELNEVIPADPVLENNSWATIKAAFRAGIADKYWSVGDEKTIAVGDNYDYKVRIADMRPNRYRYSDGSGYSNNVFEFVKCMATTRQMNPTNTNVDGFAECAMRTKLNTTIYNQLPADLKAVISEVSVESGTGDGTIEGTSASNNMLFLECEYEIFGVKSKSIGASEGSPQFDYWALHNSNDERIKTSVNENYHTRYWLRSPRSGSSTNFCAVTETGRAEDASANYSYGFCPCFVL